MQHKGGAASLAPAAGSHSAGKQSAASASLRDTRGSRLSSPVALYDAAQDIFGKSHNQLIKLRNLVASA